MVSPQNTPSAAMLASLKEGQERQLAALARLEERIGLLHEQMRRTGETVTRLKLMGDNARREAQASAEAIQRIEERLAGLEGRGER